MESTHLFRWVSAGEACTLLQRFMPHKTAQAWLENDRKTDPVIPFSYSNGAIRYRSSDLEQFVLRYLAPHAQLDFSERRARSERRHAIDRRRNPQIHLAPVAERRHGRTPDRREDIPLDRRLASARR
jgi:hypothetical protein